jgi:hypothetical protein
MCKLYLTVLGQGPVTNPFEHDNEYSDSIKSREFLDQLSDY